MTSVVKKALALIVAVCGGVALGAVSGTRLAVWDGDFSNLSQTGAALDFNDGAAEYVEDGAGNKVGIKIGNSGKGLLLKTFSESGITVVFAYSNLTVHVEKPTALAVVTAAQADDVGAGITTAGDGEGYNRGSVYSGSSNPIPNTDKNAIQYYALVYAADSSGACPGTLAYHITDAGLVSTNYYASGLKYTAQGRKVTAVALGGCAQTGSSFVSANGMVLTKVMLYSGCLSKLDLARVVKFPGYEYAQNVYTWKTTGSGNANLADAGSQLEDAAGNVYNGAGTNYSLPGAASAGQLWRYFCSGNTVAGQYAAPGSVWRFVHRIRSVLTTPRQSEATSGR